MTKAPTPPVADAADILMVDDRPENLLALEAILSGCGCRLVRAGSGPEALKKILAGDFALILMDVQMPGMDGFETAALIREREKARRTPIIFITAAGPSEGLLFKGYASGAVDYLYKPIVPEVLKAKVAVFVELYCGARKILWQEAELLRLERLGFERSLSKERRQREKLFEISTDMICVASDDGTLLQVNPSWEKTLGISREKLLGASFFELVPGGEREALRATWARLLKAAAPAVFEHAFARADGSVKWLSWNVSPAPLEGRVYAVVRDLTERRGAEEEIRELNAGLERKVEERTEELRRLVHELDSFSHSVSHDLRAPLRVIDGFSQALLEDCAGSLPPEGAADLGRIRAAALRMGELIDDLLKLSRVSREELAWGEVDLSALARGAVEALREREPGRSVEFSAAPGLRARGDARLLRVAVENLISNAWKYTGKKPKARIEFGAEPSSEGPAYYVRDDGAGFDMRYADKLFGAFQRLHHAADFPGTGVGLATVQSIVRRHGGRIWAEGEVGSGAVFRFTLGSAPEAS